jgi:threonyl-tRNA synthetase
MRVNGVTVDLATTFSPGDNVEKVVATSDEGLSIIRHSAAHVTAQALQHLHPEAKLGIGPPITDGFYYDFRVDPLTPDDLKAIEKQMVSIIKERQRFVRRVVSEEEALKEEAGEPYKLELIADKSAASDEGAMVEVGGDELTIYDNVRRDGSLAWKDLCRGPHVPHTGYITACSLTKTSAAYWRGNQANDTLQRVYGTAWATKEDLVAYRTRMEEAAKRDHRKLGTELDLFSFREEIGSGLSVFHPKGGIIRMEMEQYSRHRHVEADYSFVNTPHITKSRLFEISGHLDWYEDAMYPPMRMDEERDEDGNIRKAAVDYYLKPMNCPMHNLIYRSRGRSYRELPLRLFEFGTVYRYEKSGVVQGMLRARGFTQDDAHIYCTRDQMKDELASLLRFVLDLLRDYGFDDFYLELSTKNPDKCVGEDQVWEDATEVLRQVGEESGLVLVPDPGGAAFYGPKISVQVKDAIGRTWQISTIQLDFNLPELFDLEYVAPDGSHQRPVMIHRALFGSMERFFAVLTEHHGGAFPAWLSPVQVVGIPVAADFNDYLGEVLGQLKAHGVRVELDDSEDRMQKKIRQASRSKVPFILIAGAEDQAAQAVSFRYRDGTQNNGVPIDDAVSEILSAIAERK